MNILNNNTIAIKVVGSKPSGDINSWGMSRINVCDILDHSNLFMFIGYSRLDGFNIYQINKLTLRQLKIERIHNKQNTTTIKLYNIIKDIRKDIVYADKNRDI